MDRMERLCYVLGSVQQRFALCPPLVGGRGGVGGEGGGRRRGAGKSGDKKLGKKRKKMCLLVVLRYDRPLYGYR